MGYLITKDYLRIIQPTELNSITSNDVSIRQLVEGATEIEIRSLLMQRFNLDKEFTETSTWSIAVTYKAGNRVYLDASSYSATSTYALNSLTLYSGSVYICISAIAVPEAWTPSHWTLLGAQYDLFYVTLPKPLFDQDTYYYKGDQVFWEDKVYTALRDSIPLTQQDALQSLAIEQITKGNVVPGSRYGAEMWGSGTAYELAVGTLPTAAGWTKGDNRNQHLVEIYMNCVVYKLSSRIAPNNVPEARHNAWVKSTQDIKDYANGKRNSGLLPLIQPKTGQRVRYGGDPKEEYKW